MLTRPLTDATARLPQITHVPRGTAGAEGPPVGGSNDPQDLTPGFPGPGVGPPDHPSQPRAQSRPATGLTEL